MSFGSAAFWKYPRLNFASVSVCTSALLAWFLKRCPSNKRLKHFCVSVLFSNNWPPHRWGVWINQQIFNRKSISRNITHRRFYNKGIASRGQGIMTPKFLAYLVILCVERRCPQQNTAARLNSKILAGYTTAYNLIQISFADKNLLIDSNSSPVWSLVTRI